MFEGGRKSNLYSKVLEPGGLEARNLSVQVLDEGNLPLDLAPWRKVWSAIANGYLPGADVGHESGSERDDREEKMW